MLEEKTKNELDLTAGVLCMSVPDNGIVCKHRIVDRHCRLGADGRTKQSLRRKKAMVARLKLKGIDGRAPPGVEPAA